MGDPNQRALYEHYIQQQSTDPDNVQALANRVDLDREDISSNNGIITADVARSIGGRGTFRSASGQHGGGLHRNYEDKIIKEEERKSNRR